MSDKRKSKAKSKQKNFQDFINMTIEPLEYEKENYKIAWNRHNHWLPSKCTRMILCGPSGCGKTVVLMNLLTKKWGYEYDRLYIFTKTIEQDAYTWLSEKIPIEEHGRSYFISSELDDFEFENFDKTKKNLVILDDMLCDDKFQSKKAKDIFFRCRHYNISVLVLGQSFFDFSLAVRKNTRQFCIFHGIDGEKELKLLASALCKTPTAFVNMYNEHCEEPYSFIYYDRDSDDKQKFRVGFNHPLDINEYKKKREEKKNLTI